MFLWLYSLYPIAKSGTSDMDRIRTLDTDPAKLRTQPNFATIYVTIREIYVVRRGSEIRNSYKRVTLEFQRK